MNSAAQPTSGEVPSTPADKASATPGAKVDRSHAGTLAPDLIFTGPDGKDASLDRFRGKPLLVNLWATWCGPCVEEMPTLVTLGKARAKDGLMVLPVSQDSSGPDEISAFLKGHDLTGVPLYRDPENQLSFHYATGMLPTTVLYDRDGKEVARVVGAMDWTGEAAQKLIEEAVE